MLFWSRLSINFMHLLSAAEFSIVEFLDSGYSILMYSAAFVFIAYFLSLFAVITALRWISLFHWKVLSFYANWYAHVHFDFEVHISLIMDGHGHICSKTHSNQIIFALHSILALLHSFTTFLAAVTELGIYEWFLLMNLITRTCREEIALIMRLWTRLEGWELLKLG